MVCTQQVLIDWSYQGR